MGDWHNGHAPGSHPQAQVIIPSNDGGFLSQSGRSGLSFASYNSWGDTLSYPSHHASNLTSRLVQQLDHIQPCLHPISGLQELFPLTTQPRHSISDVNLDFASLQEAAHGQYGLVEPPETFLGFDEQVPSQVTTRQYIGFPTASYQPHPQQAFGQLALGSRGQDDDNESVGSASTDCDSHCGLADPCTDEACADREDACTDRHCPEKDCPDTNCPEKMPCEVVVAAATLATFGVGSAQQPDHVHAQQGYVSRQPYFTGLSDPDSITPMDVLRHLTAAHGDPASSNCMKSCPIDDPRVFQHLQHCPFPFPDAFHFEPDSFADLNNPFSMNSFDSGGAFNYSSQDQMGFRECGAVIPDPEALMEHINTQHRPLLENVLAPGNVYGQEAMGTLSSSSSNALDPSLSSATHSPRVSFPPTPLSLSHDLSNPSGSHGQHSRSSTVSQGAGSGNEHEQQRCRWCHAQTGKPCGQIFVNSEALFAHVNSHHIQKLEKGTEGFLCCWEDCKRRGVEGKEGFPQRSKIERHMHTHIGRKPYKCDQCGQRFSAQQALTQHELIHSNTKPLTCDWEGCGKTFRQQSALTMHRRIHTGDKPLKCPVCGKAFSESSNLSKHKRIHEKKGRFRCSEPACDKAFHRLDQMRRHLKSHASSSAAAAAEMGHPPNEEEVKTEMDNEMDHAMEEFWASAGLDADPPATVIRSHSVKRSQCDDLRGVKTKKLCIS